jgi:hypothetical protein
VPRDIARFVGGSGKLTLMRGISGAGATWTNVTPAGLDLDGTSNSNDNFGVQGVSGDLSTPGQAYAFTCYNGIWRTTDYGLTWAKRNSGGPMDLGKCWGAAVAPDGSYLLCCSGANGTQYGGVDGRRQAHRSTDGGVTFTQSGDLGADPYGFDILATDQTKVICTFHDSNHIALSTDSGQTFTDKGSIAQGGTVAELSSYAHWIDATHVLAISQVGGTSNGTFLGTLSAGAFTWVVVSSGQFHAHGSHTMDIDPSGAIINPGSNGLERSTNGGTSWSGLTMAQSVTNNIVRTGNTLYACYSFPNPAGTDCKLQHAAVPGTGTWTADSIPGGGAMTNGWMRAATDTDGVRWVIMAGCWNAGIWRYVE